MASVQRSPPPKTTRTPIKNQPLTQSEPDINSAIKMSEFVNTNRSKRPRQDNSPKEATVSNSQDIQSTLSQWKQEQEILISTLSSDIREIKKLNIQIQASNTEIRKSNEELVKSMSFINGQFEDLKKEVAELRRERQEQKQYIEKLEKKIQDLQQRSRCSGIEIRNIPLLTNESSAILTKTICNVGEAIGQRISEAELRDVYRLPGKSPVGSTSPRPIIAEFTTVQMKQSVISAVRSYNKGKGKEDKINTSLVGIPGKRQPLYIMEQLPSNTKKLFYQSREFAKSNGYQFCWISNGNIFLRKAEGDKQLLIKSETCLLDAKKYCK